ncbi:MAG: GIY-YIG nuclease family protein [bacterium]|nr:GIY-YIG nuclease family protein [bacterium]
MARTAPFSAGGGSSFGGHGTYMYYLYILESLEYKRHYIGTSADVKNRLSEHNSGEVRSTKAYRPWRCVYSEEFLDKTSARKRELFLKRNAKAREDLFK